MYVEVGPVAVKVVRYVFYYAPGDDSPMGAYCFYCVCMYVFMYVRPYVYPSMVKVLYWFKLYLMSSKHFRWTVFVDTLLLLIVYAWKMYDMQTLHAGGIPMFRGTYLVVGYYLLKHSILRNSLFEMVRN